MIKPMWNICKETTVAESLRSQIAMSLPCP